MRVLHGFMKAFAIILCIVLFLSCIAAVTLSVLIDLVKVDTLHRVATEVNWFSAIDQAVDNSDDYTDTYAFAAPRGCLAVGAVRLLPVAAQSGDALPDMPIDEDALEDMIEDIDLDALMKEAERILRTEELQAFLTYTEKFLEENGETIVENLGEKYSDAQAVLSDPDVRNAFNDIVNEIYALLVEEDRSDFDLTRITNLVDKYADTVFEVAGVEKDETFVNLAKDAVGSVAKGVAESEVLPPADKIMDVVMSGALSGMDDDSLYQINTLLGLPADAAPAETVAALRSLMNTAATIMWVCVVVLIGLIALLWWHLYRWTLPVGITLLLSGGFAFAVGTAGNVTLRMMSAVQPLVAEIADAAVLSRFTLYGGIVAAVGLLGIAAYIVLRIVLRPKTAPAVIEQAAPVFKDTVKG